jgi:hypothetical protein
VASAKSLADGAIELGAEADYAGYWLSYETARGINQIGGKFGLPGSIFSHIVALPLAIPEAVFLGGDIGIDVLKNKAFGHEEAPNDEGIVGPILPSPIRDHIPGGGPNTYLPGWRHDGGFDFEW